MGGGEAEKKWHLPHAATEHFGALGFSDIFKNRVLGKRTIKSPGCRILYCIRSYYP